MRAIELNEKPSSFGDTFRTSARALGHRARDSAIMAAGDLVGGGHGARGRLATRVMADRLMHAWLQYQAAANVKATRENVYHFVHHDYSSRIDDAELRKIIGIAPNASPVSPPPQKPANPSPQPVTSPAPPAQAPLAAASAPPQPTTARVRTTSDIMQQDNVSPKQAEIIQQKELLALHAQQQAAKAAQPAAQSSPLVANLMKQVAAQVNQPQTNAQVVIQLIANALRQTKPGTPERQNIVALIKMLQKNTNTITKVPQLAQIAVEGRGAVRSSNALAEAYPDENYDENDVEEEELNRSELDAIFVNIIQALIRRGPHTVTTPGGRQQQRAPDDDDDDDDGDIETAFKQAIDSPIRYGDLDKFVKHMSPRPDKAKLESILAVLKSFPSTPTLGRLLNNRDIPSNLRINRLNSDLKTYLLRAMNRR